MQIHQLEVVTEHEHVLDPRRGMVLKAIEKLQPGSITGITYDDDTYLCGPDGTFEVPGEVGEYYLRQKGWNVGPNPFAEQLLREHEAAEKAAAEERAAEEARAAKEAEDKEAAARAKEAAAKKAPAAK